MNDTRHLTSEIIDLYLGQLKARGPTSVTDDDTTTEEVALLALENLREARVEITALKAELAAAQKVVDAAKAWKGRGEREAWSVGLRVLDSIVKGEGPKCKAMTTQKRPKECWHHGRKVAWIDKEGKAHVQVKITDVKAMLVVTSWLREKEDKP